MSYPTHRFRSTAVLLVALGLLVSCTRTEDPMTTVPRTWRIPGYKNSVFKDVMVLAVTRDEDVRKALEDAFVADLSSDYTRARASWKLLPEHADLTEDKLEKGVRKARVDSVLLVRLLGVDEDEEYVKPRKYYKREPGKHRYKNYYRSSYEIVKEPGYFKTNMTYRLESNLYQTSDAELVWSSHSKTVNPETVDEGVTSVSQAVAGKLREEGLVR
ncbi:MAG: hypothetical protein JSV06_12460 [Myxococcales bacterium]|nr:MAG: hypothetical protein JSV06_12460 [Myxococcales bacterium]